MILVGKSYITEEVRFKNGTLYDVVAFEEYGFRLGKFYVRDEDVETDTDVLDAVKNDLGYPNCVYIKNDNPRTNLKLKIQNTEFIEDEDGIELMKQLTEIEQIKQLLVIYRSNDTYKEYYYPKYLIYEINNMAVKIPKIIVTGEGEDLVEKPSYDYLIYPDFSVNTNLLNELRALSKMELPLNIEGKVPNIEGRGFYRNFSLGLFKQLHNLYINQCDLSKGINNAINKAEHQKVAHSNLYTIYQQAQSHKKDTVAYIGYTMEGNLVERKFKEILAGLGLDLTTVSTIAGDPEQRKDFIQKYGKDLRYNAPVAYVENVLASPYDAMEAYAKMQIDRCYIRKLIFQLNMGWYDDFKRVMDYINMTQTQTITYEKALMSSKITWIYQGTCWSMAKCTFDGKTHKNCTLR